MARFTHTCVHPIPSFSRSVRIPPLTHTLLLRTTLHTASLHHKQPRQSMTDIVSAVGGKSAKPPDVYDAKQKASVWLG